MKVYLLWEVRHDLVHSCQRLKGIYLSRDKADVERVNLETANVHPLVEDHYGPLSGITYAIFENEVTE